MSRLTSETIQVLANTTRRMMERHGEDFYMALDQALADWEIEVPKCRGNSKYRDIADRVNTYLFDN